MEVRISLKDFPKICRLCLLFGDLQPIFQTNVLQLLSNLAEIEVKKGDKLPKTVCNNCIKEVESVFIFVEKCRSSDRILWASLEKENLNSKFCNDLEPEPCYDSLNNEDFKSETERVQDDGKYESDDEPLMLKIKRIEKSQQSGRSVNCQKCEISFPTSLKLSKHYRECPDCRPKRFKVHTCDICKREFQTHQQKKEHMNVHTGETPYTCSYCGKGFKFHSKLYVHIYRHKLALGQVEKKDAYTEKRVHLSLKCDKCEKIFASRSGYARHLLRHQGVKIISKNYEGTKIDKSKRSFLCNYCAKSFYIKANLDTHLRVHTGEKPFQCNDCGKQFKQKGALDRHALSHLDARPKPFSCEICQKTFTTKAHMNVHKRLHTGVKPYQCTFCGKSFNYRSHWRIHLRMHTGESPYFCTVCGNTYHDKGSLRKHQKKKGHLSQAEHTAKSECKEDN